MREQVELLEHHADVAAQDDVVSSFPSNAAVDAG